MKKVLLASAAVLMGMVGAASADPFADAWASGNAGTIATDFASTFAAVNPSTRTQARDNNNHYDASYTARANGRTGGSSIALDGGSAMESRLALHADGSAEASWGAVDSSSDVNAEGFSVGSGDLVVINHDVRGAARATGYDSFWNDDAEAGGNARTRTSVNAVDFGGHSARAGAATDSFSSVSTTENDPFL